MKKRLLYLLVPALLLAGFAIFLRIHYDRLYESDQAPPEYRHAITDKEIHDAAVKWGHLAPGAPTALTLPHLDRNQPVRLAIGSLGMTNQLQDQELGDLVLADLSGDRGFNMVERKSTDAALHELGLGLSGLVRSKDAVRAGKIVKADWFLMGSSTKVTETNSIIVRLVDARTGIHLDVGILPANDSLSQLSSEIARFVRQSRLNNANGMSRVYLAIGAFEDLSVNSRRADFPNQLRVDLMSAFRASNVTLLEREQVDALRQEMELDLAGLTETSDGLAQPMQSAFWLVTGQYQSYENNGFEVELSLRITRIFGRHPKQVILQGAPGGALVRQVKQAIEAQINQRAIVLAPTRRTEAMNQMAIGKDLFTEHGRIEHSMAAHFELPNGLPFLAANDHHLRGEEAVRRRQNLLEALRAFQTVMVLDPTNREARLCMAACLQNPVMGRLDEAREYYRQILEEPVDDKWVALAKQNLLYSFDGEGPWGEQPWFARAAAQSQNPAARDYFQEVAERTAKSLNYESTMIAGKSVETEPTDIDKAQAKTNLLEDVQAWKEGTGHRSLYAIMETFANAFGTNLAGASALVDFLPKMEAAFPEFRPHLQGAVVCFQVDTNAPILADFLKTLDWSDKHPRELNKADEFWGEMHHALLPWAYEHACFEFAAKIIAHDQKSRAPGANYFNDERLVLAMEYFEHQQWRNALEIFQCYSNRPKTIRVDDRLLHGKWVKRSGLILTGKYAAACEEKLGLAHVSDSREFDLGKPCLELDDASIFITDSTGLWVASHSELRHLNFDLQTDKRISLPAKSAVTFNCICSGDSKIWIGTDGDGLIEADLAKRECRRFTVGDGLLMNSISQLHLASNLLWIGYANGHSGGLGMLDLSSQRFRSFVPRFSKTANLTEDPVDGPPRHAVIGLTTVPNGDVLALVSEKGVQRFAVKDNRWETLPNQNGHSIVSIAANGRHWVEGDSIGQVVVEIRGRAKRGQPNSSAQRTELAVSQPQLAKAITSAQANTNVMVMPIYGLLASQGAIYMKSLQDSRWQSLSDSDGMPNPPEKLTWSDNDLWVSGEGYIAQIDVERRAVRKFCYIPARSVKRVEAAGGYLWALLDGHLYRQPF